MIGAVIFYLWYIYTGAIYNFIDFYVTGRLYTMLKFSAPLTLLDGEVAAILLFSAPIFFTVVTAIINLLLEFTKKQKIILTVMPMVSYALFFGMDYIRVVYF